MGLPVLWGLVLVPAALWATAALWFDGPFGGWLAAPYGIVVVALLGALRPLGRAAVAVGLSVLLVAGWWVSIPPRNDRPWLADVARPPTATFDGDRVTIHNLRNFRYRSETDYDERWEQRSFDLSKLTGADLFLSYWGSPWIAHTIVSWEFESGPPLAISIETRKEVGEEYSAIRGFFRQYELYYVAADERDVIALRTNHRGEEVYLYRLTTSVSVARSVLLDYLKEMNALAEAPRWYNAATHNCTTMIRHHTKNVAAENPWDWRILVNGRIDALGYERGTIPDDLPFAELRARSDITERARAAGDDAGFSQRIRVGLPGARMRAK